MDVSDDIFKRLEDSYGHGNKSCVHKNKPFGNQNRKTTRNIRGETLRKSWQVLRAHINNRSTCTSQKRSEPGVRKGKLFL